MNIEKIGIVGQGFVGTAVNEGLKICPENLPRVGIDIRTLDNDQTLLNVTNKISIKNALNNEDLQIHIALLKLKAANRVTQFAHEDLETGKITKYGLSIPVTF